MNNGLIRKINRNKTSLNCEIYEAYNKKIMLFLTSRSVAQLAEQLTLNQRVWGSSPHRPTNKNQYQDIKKATLRVAFSMSSNRVTFLYGKVFLNVLSTLPSTGNGTYYKACTRFSIATGKYSGIGSLS